MIKEKINEFIKRANELKDIDKANRKKSAAAGIADLRNNMPSEINQWMSEIKLFNERHLKNHPLYTDINSVCFHNKGRYDDYNKMLGLLRALQNDDEIENNQKPTYKPVGNLKEMLENDIVQCQSFLDKPRDEESIKNFYIIITSRYDSIIDNFGNGLYSYFSEQHFYDSDVGIGTIKHNLNILFQKMITYHAIKFEKKVEKKMVENDKIFISHRSLDKDIADMLFEFFISTGIPREKIFCSSLPGNDVKQKISNEVKTAMIDSAINIAILSDVYYESAYCLNEAGIIWFQDNIPAILIALPEISEDKMYGFLNSDYKIRRIDNNNDIAYIYDKIIEVLSLNSSSSSVITTETNKLLNKYKTYIQNRQLTSSYPDKTSNDELVKMDEITTDDERVVLSYVLQYNARKVEKNVISNWLTMEEIYNINIDNAFDLLSTFGNSTNNGDTLELDITFFREISSIPDAIKLLLKNCVENHRKLSRIQFKSMWENNSLTNIDKLFIAYIIDENISTFGDRWMAEGQIKDIESWENKWCIQNELSQNYGSCLSKFIENNFVFESSWTSHGNARAYTLHKSIKDFLFHKDFPFSNEINNTRDAFHFDLSF